MVAFHYTAFTRVQGCQNTIGGDLNTNLQSDILRNMKNTPLKYKCKWVLKICRYNALPYTFFFLCQFPLSMKVTWRLDIIFISFDQGNKRLRGSVARKQQKQHTNTFICFFNNKRKLYKTCSKVHGQSPRNQILQDFFC